MGANGEKKRLRRGIRDVAARVANWAAEGINTVSSPLSPLTPEFVPDQHQSYVEHLNAALRNRKVRNIALTGRYGAGKSSILEEFARQPRIKKRVLFLSLSTLGPSGEIDDSRTSQIEKELVKQLLHREKPASLPQSRYQRIAGLPRWRATVEATVLLAAIGLALWLFGAFPRIPGLSSDHPWWLRLGAAIAAGTTAVGIVTRTRLAVHNRLVVSEVSAGGASISLADKSESYFDQYLDEIVYFFESIRKVDIAIFEDLDRFDDPGIFEALRELNTLLNNSKQMNGRTIRFVYALRDSIFEKLGYDTIREEGDAAHAEAVRANRTKFFDLVIPVVPFITHRTSRDLLTNILNSNNLAPISPVSPELIDLTARHLPDMRLLTNIRNEYAVFEKHLISDKRGVNSLEVDKLFAMVVYKNIHLSDFELILLGRSKLDALYRLSRNLVTESTNVRQAELRHTSDAIALQEALARRAVDWGEKLAWYFEKIKDTFLTGYSLAGYNITGTEFKPDQIITDKFWRKLIDGNAVTARYEQVYQQNSFVNASLDDVKRLLGENFPIDDWDGAEREELARKKRQLQEDLETLRTADFKDLVKRSDFTVTSEADHVPFKALLIQLIDSEVGRALITEGFIDRYYALYVAQYYGERVPTNALNFIVQNVDANLADITYPLTIGEVAAVLRETSRSFLSDVSAYNINILDYLFEHDDAGAHTILKTVMVHIGDPEQQFLNSYIANGAHAAAAVGYLARRWPIVFTQLVETVDLTHGKRIELVNVALANSGIKVKYELSTPVRTFLQDNYKSLSAIAITSTKTDNETDTAPDAEIEPSADTGARRNTDTYTADQVRSAIITMTRAGFVCDDLATLRPLAARLAVERDCYIVTAANLRTAVGNPNTLSLDSIRALDSDVYEDVLEHLDDYLEAITNDLGAEIAYNGSADGEITQSPAASGDTNSTPSSRTPWTVDDPDMFADVVADLKDHGKQQAAAVISRANPDCVIENLTAVPDTTWEALAKCMRFPATLANVNNHITHLGELDADLAAILTSAGRITASASENEETSAVKVHVAESILNASDTLPDQELRVQLVSSLDLDNWLPTTNIRPEPGPLLGLLIAERICSDSPALFSHFNTDDWNTLRYAIKQSTKFSDFVSPDLMNAQLTSQLLVSRDIEASLKQTMLTRFDEFIPADSRAALSAAGHAALETSTRIDAKHVATIAAGTANADLVLRLLHQLGDSISTDELIDTLLHLPKPYSELSNSGARLTFPRNDHNAAVLKRLHNASRITTRTYERTLKKPARIDVVVR